MVVAASVDRRNAGDAVRAAAKEDIAKGGRRMGRLIRLVNDLGVKARILISLSQVLGQVGTTYKITFPDFYGDILSAMASVNLPVKVLPFGCSFPHMDNYMFELILKTAGPLCRTNLKFASEPSHSCGCCAQRHI
eukprot:7386223-Prymnesium_polylepis.1